MPTVLRVDGFVFRIFASDHGPPHVHVFARGTEAKISLEGPRLLEDWGMRARDVRMAMRIVAEHRQRLLDKWRRIHDG